MKATRELPDGSRLVHEYEDMALEKRPQDPRRDASNLSFKPVEHGWEGCPGAIVVSDAQGRQCTFEAEGSDEPCPRSDHPEGTDLSYEVLEYGGGVADDMPLLLRVTDPGEQSGFYRPITEAGCVVDSKGYRLLPGDVLARDR